MNKILTVILLCLGFATSMSSQALSFNANTTNTSIAIGDTVIVDVTTSNFAGIEFYQYTLEWDPSVAELITLVDCNSDISLNCLLGGIHFNETDPGIMRSIWSDQGGGKKSLSDNTKLFTIRFEAKTAGPMNIRFTDNGATREAQGDNGFFEGDQILTTVTGASEVEGSGNGGGNTSDNLGFTVGDLTGVVGSNVCVPVTAANFTDVVLFEYTMEWDSTVLDLVSLANCNTDLMFNCTLGAGNTNERIGGIMRTSWIDQATTGVTVADDAVLFEMCFDLLSAGTTNISITDNDNETGLGADVKGADGMDQALSASEIDITNGTATVTTDNGGGNTSDNLGFTVGDLTGVVGSNVCVPVTAANFTDVVLFEYTMEWDSTVLDLVSLANCNTDLMFNCTLGAGNTNERIGGIMRTSWIDQATTGVTVADDAVLFEMCFDLLSAGTTNISITDNDNETGLGADVKGADGMDQALSASEIDITNGTATVTTDNGGGNTSDNLGFTVGDLTGEVGSNVCIPVTVANFTDVVLFEYTVEWDSTVLDLVSLANCNADLPFNCTLGVGNTNERIGGIMRTSWLDQATTGVTLADDAVLFEMCFDLLSAGTTNISITNNDNETGLGVDVKGADGTDQTLSESEIDITNGTATVTTDNGGGNTSDNLGFAVGDLTGEVGSNVCVPVTVANFTDVVLFEYTVEWDSTVLDLVSLANCNADLSFNCTLGVGNTNERIGGIMRTSWLDQATTGITLADDAVLFEMCFDLLSAGTTNISITNNDNETALGVDVKGADGTDQTLSESEIDITNGTATVTTDNGGGGGNTDNLSFTVGDLTGEVGSNVCVPVTAANFTDVVLFEYTVEWDSTVLDLVSLANCNADLSFNCTLGVGNTNERIGGIMRTSWLDQATTGITLADDAVLFEMCFDLLSAGTTNISITNNDNETALGVDVKGADGTDQTLSESEIDITNGTATVTTDNGGGGGNTDNLGFAVGDLTGEVGSNVCVPVTAANFTDVVLFEYTVEWDSTVLDLVSLANCNADLSFNCTLGVGNTNERIGGIMRTSWLDQATTGVTIADDAVLFEMCFDLLSAGTTNISITNNDNETALGVDVKGADGTDQTLSESEIDITNGTATVTADNGGGGGNTDNLSFTVGDLTGEVGSNVCVPVTAANFTDVVLFEYTVEWDSTVLDLVSLANCNADLSFNCTLGVGNTNERIGGIMRTSWLDQATTGVTIADDAVLFEMCFDLLSAGTTNISITNNDNETALGVDVKAADGTDQTLSESEIDINNGTATVTEDNGGGGGNTDNLSFTVGDLTGEVGSNVCVPVTAANFTDVVLFEYTVEWDSTVLDLVSLANCNADLSFNCTLGIGNTNERIGGIMRTSWLDQATTGVTIADDAVLFEMCFDLLSAGTTNISITNNDNETGLGVDVKAADGTDQSLSESEININNGTATVTADNGGGGGMMTGPLKLSTTSANVEAGATTCLNVMAENFVDITSFSFSQTWDASVFELDGVMACNSALTGLNCGLGNANFTLVGNNRVDIIWTDASGNGVTIPSGQPLFELCFKAIGNPGDGTNIAYGTNISASNKDGALDANEIETQDAQISINGTTNNGKLTFLAEGKMGDVGETVCVQVTAENFDDIVFFQYTMEWDEAVLELENLNACNSDLGLNCALGQTNFNKTSDGSLRASWADSESVGRSVVDGALLYELCFKIIGDAGDNSLVRFTSNQIGLEAQQGEVILEEQDIVVQNGFVSVNDNGGGTTPPLVFNIDEGTGRQNDTVCVAITAENFNDIVHFQYNIEWNTAVLQFVDVESCNSRLDGLNCVEGPTSSNFNMSSEGLIRTSWIHTPTTGASVPDGEVLFTFCFKLVGNSGASSAIRITDTELGIEAGNPDGDIPASNIIVNNGKINIVTVMPVANVDRVQTTDILCNGASTGTIDIDVSGGIAPLTYSWTNGATTQDLSGVPAGTYRVSVTDAENRIIVSDMIQLFEPSAIAVGNIQVTQPNSETNVQGAIDIAVSGGSSPFTFVWSNGATTEDISGLAAGCYNVTITDRNNCTFSPSEICVEDEISALSTLTANPNDVICPTGDDGSIAFSFNGGIAPFTFTLSTGATLTSPSRSGTFSDLTVGDYTIVVTDAQNDNLSGTVSIDFTSTFFVEGAVITSYNGFDVSGFGRTDATITASANGTVPPYTYEWSDNLGTTGVVANVGAGTYTVTITDGNGCVSSTQVTVNEPQELRANATADLMPGCKNVCEGEASINVEGGVAPYDFLWSTGSTQGVLFDLCAGNYSVSVTDANSITTVSSISVSEPDSLKLEFEATSPSTVTGSDGSAIVIATGGTAPYSYQWNDNNGTQTAEVTGLAPDTYFVIVTDANGCQEVGMVDITRPTADCFESRNIITIDGDGMNENLIIQCADNVQNTLQIFNRWGQLVFDATNYDNTWEGTDRRGDQLPEGGYFWVLRVTESNGDITEHKNHVTILTAE